MTLLQLHQARANTYSAWMNWSTSRAKAQDEYQYGLTMEAKYYTVLETIDLELERRTAK